MGTYITPPADVAFEQLVAALRRYLSGMPEDAATQLLIEHGRWIRGSELRGCIEWFAATDDNPECAWIVWPDVAALLAEGLPASGSEKAILAVAVSIASGPVWEAAVSCDDRNWRLVLAAITAARDGA